MSRPKQVNNSLLLYEKVIHATYKTINKLKEINLLTKGTLRLRRLLMILVLTVMVILASCQVSEIRPS